MALKDSVLIDNLVNRGELPSTPVYITDDTFVKFGLVVTGIIVVTVLVIRFTAPKK